MTSRLRPLPCHQGDVGTLEPRQQAGVGAADTHPAPRHSCPFCLDCCCWAFRDRPAPLPPSTGGPGVLPALLPFHEESHSRGRCDCFPSLIPALLHTFSSTTPPAGLPTLGLQCRKSRTCPEPTHFSPPLNRRLGHGGLFRT